MKVTTTVFDLKSLQSVLKIYVYIPSITKGVSHFSSKGYRYLRPTSQLTFLVFTIISSFGVYVPSLWSIQKNTETMHELHVNWHLTDDYFL